MIHSQIAAERGAFTVDDVVQGICEKMVRRHPHVFSGAQRGEDLHEMWEAVKTAEHAYRTAGEKMQAVPKSFPALLYAQKLQEKAAGVHFDFPSSQACLLYTSSLF